jgi:hypothetical protein
MNNRFVRLSPVLIAAPGTPRQRPRPHSRVGSVLQEKHVSFVTTQPEALTTSAGNLPGIGSAMSAANGPAAAPATGVITAAADEVPALTATQFAAHTRMYQAVSAQAAAIHEILVNTLGTGAGSYAATGAASAAAAS